MASTTSIKLNAERPERCWCVDKRFILLTRRVKRHFRIIDRSERADATQ